MGRLEDGKEKGKKEKGGKMKGGKEWEGRVRKERRGARLHILSRGPRVPSYATDY